MGDDVLMEPTRCYKTSSYDRITALHSDGMTLSEIAKKLDRPLDEVRSNVCWFVKYGNDDRSDVRKARQEMLDRAALRAVRA